MKQTLITLAALALGGAMAGAGTLPAQWDFDGNLTATSGGVNGTAKGNITYTDSLTANTILGDYKVAADMGQALVVSGTKNKNTGSWVGLGDIVYKDSLTLTSSFTVSAFVNFSTFTGDFAPIFATGSGTGSGLLFGVSNASGGGYCFDFLTKSVDHQYTTAVDGLSANTWCHIAVSYDATDKAATWYLNGSAVITQDLASATMNAPGGEGSAIGSNGQDENNAYEGTLTLDKVQVYSSALSQADIVSHAGLVANTVPEPATATLSLLALAGLAARRRRK